MFEQAYYNSIPAEPTSEGDFLHDYEVKGWKLTPRLYQILAVAVVANIAMITVFLETPFMTARGCDGPLVNRVCEVLDTVYVGTKLFGTDRQVVDEAYKKTELGDADITFIDVSNADSPLEYPQGYFQIANPEEYAARLAQQNQMSMNSGYIAPGIPANPTTTVMPGLVNTPQVLPTPNPNAVEGDLPTFDNSNPTTVTSPGTKKGGGGGRVRTVPGNPTVAGITKNPTVTASPSPAPTIPPGAPTDPNAINKRPFKDLAAKVLGLQADKKVDLQAPVQLSATAKIDKDGKITPGTFKFIKVVSSDPQLVDVVKDAVSAFNDSNLLQYLQPISGERIDFSILQDQANITAGIESDLERESKANAVVGIIKLGIQEAITKKQDEIQKIQMQLAVTNTPELVSDLQNEQDDLALLQNTLVKADGKKLSISFTAPKDILHQMIQRKLDEQAAEMKKENGNATGTPNSNNAVNKY
jgi:hypothetical protein